MVQRETYTGMRHIVADNPLRDEFIREDEDYRYAYAEDFLNTYIATQIKVLRDQRQMKQEDLANAIGTKQSGISRLENVNYSNWKTDTLKKLARALGVRLRISFETFGSLLDEDATFSRERLMRPKFEDDPAFSDNTADANATEQPETARLLKVVNTGPETAVYGFRGDPGQAEFNFMYETTPTIDQLIITHADEDHQTITVEDFIEANRDLAIAFWATRNVEEKEAA